MHRVERPRVELPLSSPKVERARHRDDVAAAFPGFRQHDNDVGRGQARGERLGTVSDCRGSVAASALPPVHLMRCRSFPASALIPVVLLVLNPSRTGGTSLQPTHLGRILTFEYKLLCRTHARYIFHRSGSGAAHMCLTWSAPALMGRSALGLGVRNHLRPVEWERLYCYRCCCCCACCCYHYYCCCCCCLYYYCRQPAVCTTHT